MNKIEEAIIDYWGEKCQNFDENCFCCQAWKEYEELLTRAISWKKINEYIGE